MKKLCLIILFLIICSSIPLSAQQNDEQWYRTELHFGMSRQQAVSVTEAQWNKFSDEYITPCFENGYTLYYATECRKDPDTQKTINEKTCIVIFVYKNRSAKDYCISSMMKTYKELFPQHSVVRMDSEVKTEFK